MSAVLWNTLFFIITLGILVTVHEFGHFWVARRCGVKVERFSVGFGKAIWRRIAKDGTEYTVAMIPLGGYVKMLDERVEEVPEHLQDQAFNRKTLGQRSAIVAAGPIANFLLAIVAFWLMFLIGVPAIKPVLGDIATDSIAGRAQLQAGQEIISVEGKRTQDWEAVNLSLVQHIGDERVQIEVQDSQRGIQSVTLNTQAWELDSSNQQSPLATLGLTPFTPAVSLEVARVLEGGAADKAGVLEQDLLVSVNGEALSSWQDFVEWVQQHPDQALQLQVKRGGYTESLVLTPTGREVSGKLQGYVGLAPVSAPYPESYQITLQYGPIEAIGKALERTWHLSELTVAMIGKLVTGVVSLDNLSGPISIAKGAGTTAQYGLVYFLGFVALVSVNLGIINLFPLPVLDGGHLVFFAVEAVTRKPVSERVQEIAFRIGAALVMTIMIIAVFNDVARL